MFYIFGSFTLLVCGEKNILPNLTNSQEPEPEPEPLEKKSGAGAGAAKKLAGSSALREDKKQHKEIINWTSAPLLREAGDGPCKFRNPIVQQ